MDHRRGRRQPDPTPTPPPNPHPPPSPLSNISNFQTPNRPHFRNPNPNPSPSPIFFTANKATPSSSFRRKTFTPSLPQSKAARKLQTLQLQQSRSARKTETLKQKRVQSFTRSMAAWLNFLFDNPRECGCEVQNPRKRQRGEEERGVELGGGEVRRLTESLKDVCSLDDLRERMAGHLSQRGCEEVLEMMSRLSKNIDDGRLKMKSHCPIVTDFAIKEKATRVLMCYNPVWLRIGLHIIFGGDLLLSGGKSDDTDFLKLTIESQFFTHVVIARSYAYNRFVEGLYRPGYYEALGSIILKRFLLLVILLDKAKCEITLPLKYGIDGIDSGLSPLFNIHSHIKSSRQAVQEFLMDSMHGEGDLLAHLVILGCKLNYQQLPLAEYQFKINNLFEDLQDGILLCRAIQLLKSDESILSKLVVPSDTHKKSLQNCNTAIQHLKSAGVPLSDDDGIFIIAEDIVNGDRELTLSILWNMFVHLQVPLLVDKGSLAREISKIKGYDMDLSKCYAFTEVSLLLSWIQAICDGHSIKLSKFSSIFEGGNFFCLIDYYFCNEICRYSSTENQSTRDEEFTACSDHVTTEAAHNLAFVQTITSLFGNIPEVFQLCDMLDPDASFDERSVTVFLVFLASRLICQKDLDVLKYKHIQENYRRKFFKPLVAPQSTLSVNIPYTSNKVQRKNLLEFESPQKRSALDANLCEDNSEKVRLIQAQWRAPGEKNLYLEMKFAACIIQRAFRHHLSTKHTKAISQEFAACVIQSRFRGFTVRRQFLKVKMAASLVQNAVRAWLRVKLNPFSFVCSSHQASQGICDGYLRFLTERHRFLRIKRSVLVIQQAVKVWVKERRLLKEDELSEQMNQGDSITAITMHSLGHGQITRSKFNDSFVTESKKQNTCPSSGASEHLCTAAIKIQITWKTFTRYRLHLKEQAAAVKIQSYWRAWYSRKKKLCKIAAAIKIQVTWKEFTRHRVYQERAAAIRIQSYWRAWYSRKKLLCQIAAATKIQTGIRSVINQVAYSRFKFSAIEIQRFVRGHNTRKKLLGASNVQCGTSSYHELKITIHSIVKLQRWWKHLLLIKSTAASVILIQSFIRGWRDRKLTNKMRHSVCTIQRWWRNTLINKSRANSAISIQALVRGWLARRAVERDNNNIVLIQSYWKGYRVRKGLSKEVMDLRSRIQKSAVSVDESMRLINRLIAALSELLGYRSVSNIRHTCATLNFATELSRKCCEELVAAGAIVILLKQFNSLNRGIPDQEVLKHIISTLRNISIYPQLLQVLINTPEAVETIFQEVLRNKSDGFFLACELLKKMCSALDGLNAARSLQFHVRRLSTLVLDLERKSELYKRNSRLCAGKDMTIQKLKVATDLMLLISGDC